MGRFGDAKTEKISAQQAARRGVCRQPGVAFVARPGGCLALVFAVLCFITTPVDASQNFMAAGALLVADEQQPALTLLVRHHSRSFFEMPGGRRQLVGGPDGERRETARETAIREVFEETRGYLSAEYLRNTIDKSRSMRDGGFVFFVASIDHFPTSAMAEISHLDDDSAAGFREVADYAWVTIESVLGGDGVSVTDVEGRSIRLRPQLKSRLLRARAAGWL